MELNRGTETVDGMSASELILLLRNSLKDSLSNSLIEKNVRLLEAFLKVSNNKIMINDVLNVSYVLDNLLFSMEKTEEYSAAIRSLLILLYDPPHNSKLSDAFHSVVILRDYLNILGGLLLKLVAEETFQKMILIIIHNLFREDLREDRSIISISFCVEALELSCLPQRIATIMKMDLQINNSEFFIVINDISEYSKLCCLRLAEFGIMDVLLSSIASAETKVERSNAIDNQFFNMKLNIIWRLMRTCHNEDCSKHIDNISSNAFSDFMTLLTKVTQGGNISNSLKSYRNNLFAVLVQLIYISPDLLLSSSKDCLLKIVRNRKNENMLVEIESDEMRPNPKFDKQDSSFERMFLLAIKYSVASSSEIKDTPFKLEVMELLIGYLTSWINPSDYISWCSVQSNQILMSFNILPSIVPELLDQFIMKNGPYRYMQLLELFKHEMIGLSVLFEAIQSLFKICTRVKNHTSLPGLLKQIDVSVLIKLAGRVLEMEVMSSMLQKILTYLLCTIQLFYQDNLESSAKRSLFTIANDSFKRALYARRKDSNLSTRLNVAIADFLWIFVVNCPENFQRFVQKMEIYSILDILQIMPRPLKMKYLSILADICEDTISIPFLITWRSRRKEGGLPIGSGIIQLLCHFWRQEEELIGVKRDEYGCIEDWEEPVRGEEEREIHVKAKQNGEAGMLDMFGDMRIRIYIIIYYLRFIYKSVTSIAEEKYKLNYMTLSAQDEVTLTLIESYFNLRVGEIWKDLSRDNVHCRPTNDISPVYNDVVEKLAKRHDLFSQSIQRDQKDIVSCKQKKTLQKEEELLSLNNSCKLALTLKAVRELCLNARIENREFLLQAKNELTEQIKECRRREGENEAVYTHSKSINITTMSAGRENTYRYSSNENELVLNDSESKEMIERLYPVPSDTRSQYDLVSSSEARSKKRRSLS